MVPTAYSDVVIPRSDDPPSLPCHRATRVAAERPADRVARAVRQSAPTARLSPPVRPSSSLRSVSSVRPLELLVHFIPRWASIDNEQASERNTRES